MLLFIGGARRESKRLLPMMTQMLGQFISVLCVLAVVILGLLVMTRVITFEQLVSGVGRFLPFVIGLLVALCFLKAVLVAVIVPWLVSLKAVFLWLVLAVLGIITLVLIVRITISKFQN
jgi:hypothetical protein